MPARLRVAYLIAAVLLLLILPVSSSELFLALSVAVDLGVAALVLRRRPAAQPQRIVPLGHDATDLDLRRRPVPALRLRHPTATVEAHVRWRAAAEARRQLRVIS